MMKKTKRVIDFGLAELVGVSKERVVVGSHLAADVPPSRQQQVQGRRMKKILRNPRFRMKKY